MKSESVGASLEIVKQELYDCYDQGFAAGVESMRVRAQDQDLINAVAKTAFLYYGVSNEEAQRAVMAIIKELGFGKPPEPLDIDKEQL